MQPSVDPDNEDEVSGELLDLVKQQQAFVGQNWQTYGQGYPLLEQTVLGSAVSYPSYSISNVANSGVSFVSSPDLGMTSYTNAASLLPI